ncbi:ABC transporter ATP-binding protein [Hugenholtzia roseola]|uniref:ABC transporter ATP-binding protein n=1 Tax=Hugenholtzia roseola TaxID=1002 RepID=UPI0003F927A3|nr:ABC transporter ATP-binding protein [Hugenholtzia roseola]
MLKVEKVSKIYTDTQVPTRALEDISLTISTGEFVAIMGASGCGKSTLLHILGLLDMPTSGELFFMDKKVSALKSRERTLLRREYIGFVFQNFNLIEELTVYENIELPLLYKRFRSQDRKQKIELIMEQMDIAHKRHAYPSQLAGGQQQRVAVARAVVGEPPLILADEPTGNLDFQHGQEVMNIFTQLHSNQTTIVMVTHSRQNANFAERIVHLFDGHIVNNSML